MIHYISTTYFNTKEKKKKTKDLPFVLVSKFNENYLIVQFYFLFFYKFYFIKELYFIVSIPL